MSKANSKWRGASTELTAPGANDGKPDRQRQQSCKQARPDRSVDTLKRRACGKRETNQEWSRCGLKKQHPSALRESGQTLVGQGRAGQPAANSDRRTLKSLTWSYRPTQHHHVQSPAETQQQLNAPEGRALGPCDGRRAACVGNRSNVERASPLPHCDFILGMQPVPPSV